MSAVSGPVTILSLAEFLLGRPAVDGTDFYRVGFAIMGGCEICGATLAAYNACPSKTDYWRCLNGCIGDDGWYSAKDAARDLFGS